MRKFLRAFGRCATGLLSVQADDPDLLKAQYRAFSYQLPMLYCILLISAWVLAIPHIGRAPFWMAVVVPAVSTVVCVTRGLRWWRRMSDQPSAQKALKSLRNTNRLTPLLATLYIVWAMALFPYGDEQTQGQVAFFMGITAIGCIFCLMHLRSAALMVAVIDTVGLAVFLIPKGNSAYNAQVVNVALVMLALFVILMYHHQDFRRMVALNRENRSLANRDSLTGLPNRRSFFDQLDEAVSRAQLRQQRLAVGILDLDGFKPINDLYGHAMGDRLLRAVAERLTIICGDRARLTRLAGDEFALLIDDDDAVQHARNFGTEICEALKEPFALGESTIQIGGSLGMSIFPDHARASIELYEFADYALYQVKRNRRGTTNLFSVDHDTQMQRDAAIEIALRNADLENELSVMFQPLVDVSNGRIVAFEALARWTNPELGQVPPDQFIPIAERSGLIGRLTLVLLAKALFAAERWPRGINLSFNLSANDLCSADVVLQIIQLINARSFDPRHIDFEMTETALLQDINQVQGAIRLLKHLGCGVSLDDFGTGYASLSHLHAMPFTKIKIDRSFVQAIDHKPASYKIVKSLLALSRDMGIDCVIEGVETDAEIALLQSLGGEILQGYYFSPPIGEEDIADFIANHEARPRRVNAA